jgi:hypothetical protein
MSHCNNELQCLGAASCICLCDVCGKAKRFKARTLLAARRKPAPRIALLGCGSVKANCHCVAFEMYRSQLFRFQLRYALITCDRYYILSAKHGLLRHNDIIEPYEHRLPSGPGRTAWGKLVASQLDSAVPEFDAEIVVLAGSAYADAFEANDRDWNWSEPLRGMPVGKRLAWLKAHARFEARS